MSFRPVDHIKVGLSFGESVLPVGRLARRERKIYFEYASEFIAMCWHITEMITLKILVLLWMLRGSGDCLPLTI